MASSSSNFTCQKQFSVLVLGFLLFLSIPQSMIMTINAHPLRSCDFDQVYQLGDSNSDTGNLIREPFGATTPFARFPYGESFFKNATGRCSNGLVMTDYLAFATRLPDLLPPYKDIDSDFKHGVNFAVAGATALPYEELMAKNIISPMTTSSLGVQLQWMYDHFNSICLDHRDCLEKLNSALFMVGEIGGNDYNYAIFQGKTMEELKNMVPDVVGMIIHAVKMVIELGATRVVVPGNIPIGCLPIYQTAFKTNFSEAYDENQCLKQLNGFAMYHNEQLQQALHELKQVKPNAIIVYGDYYTAYQYLFEFFKTRGYETQKACCGIGGDYNFNMTRMCGSDSGVPVCKDPERYMSWDGVHLTHKGYNVMSRWFLHDIFNKLQCH